ncbi:hypothetical protein [Streptomyces sp. NPDC058595]|uniref:hypothetical protein n=1 Tax=Streptomyces sp. NPDC058595 TaxID=3346550 RepID=UPI003665585D
MVTQLSTASGTVRITAVTEPDDAGAVLYEVAGAVKGTVHVCGTHNSSEWEKFDTVRVSLGSTSLMRRVAPEASLPRVRGRAYVGSLVHLPQLPDDAWENWQLSVGGLRTPDDREAPPQAASSLTAVMRACGTHYAARTDFPRLMDAARAHQTPALLRFLKWAIPQNEREAEEAERKVQQYRREARTALASLWQVARMFQTCPSLPLAVLLARYRESLAHRANYLPRWVEVYADSVTFHRRRITHYRKEYAELSARRVRKAPGGRGVLKPHASKTTVGAHRARKARSPRWADRRPRPASVRPTSTSVGAARTRLARSYRHGERSRPWLKTSVTRGEWPRTAQNAAIERGGMAAATAWRSGAYGRPAPAPPFDRSMLPREERVGRPQRR